MSLNRKGLRKRITRHAEANYSNPKERPIRLKIQARQARKTEIHEREKRIASFLGKEKENTKMEIPPLSHTFRSAGLINPGAIWSKVEEMSIGVDEAFGSLYIDMVKVGDQEASNTGYFHYRGDKFWTTGPLLNFPLFLNFQTSNDHEQPSVSA